MDTQKSTNAIEDSILTLRQHVRDYRKALNDEGVWLFLATLGCLGVPGKALQLGAITVTILLFGRRLQERLSDRRPFSKMISDIRSRAETELEEGDAKKARLYELIQVEKVDLSVTATFKEGWVFLVCWGFLTITLAHSLWQ